MSRLPLTGRPVATPHGAFGAVRRSPAEGSCGVRAKYPCTHQGMDLASPAGTPVYAPERCQVVLVAFDNRTPGLRGFGPGALKCKGASGAVHTFGHLDPEWWRQMVWTLPRSPFEGFRERRNLPAEGRVYEEGEQLGVIAAPANHVHWEVSVDGRKVDPLAWVTGRGGGQGSMLWLLLLLLVASDNRRNRR